MITPEVEEMLVRILERGRIPSTVSSEQEAFVYKWLVDHGHGDVADMLQREAREA